MINDDYLILAQTTLSQLRQLKVSESDGVLSSIRSIPSSYIHDSDPGEATSMMRCMATIDGREFPITLTIDPFFRVPEVRPWKQNIAPQVMLLDDSLPEIGRAQTRGQTQSVRVAEGLLPLHQNMAIGHWLAV